MSAVLSVASPSLLHRLFVRVGDETRGLYDVGL